MLKIAALAPMPSASTLWDIAVMATRAGRPDAALAAITKLAESRNPYRARALEALAKHYEHGERNYGMALEMTRGALALGEAPQRSAAKSGCASESSVI
jgi:hypothetical protein